MIHVLLITHGSMAEGMVSSVRMLIGAQEDFDYVTFAEDMGQDELKELLDTKITGASAEKQYLIMCDLKGGTPFNVASRYSFKNDHISVFYGVNLPILIETLIGREGKDLAEITPYLQEAGPATLGIGEI